MILAQQVSEAFRFVLLPLPFQHAHPGEQPSTLLVLLCMYTTSGITCFFLRAFSSSSPAVAGLFSRFRLRGTRETRRYITTHVWPPSELCDACSGRPKSDELALLQAIRFRVAEPRRTMKTHTTCSESRNKPRFKLFPSCQPRRFSVCRHDLVLKVCGHGLQQR